MPKQNYELHAGRDRWLTEVRVDLLKRYEIDESAAAAKLEETKKGMKESDP